jgi:hypothetical protein
MQLFITPHGTVVCIYSEALDLTPLGSLSITRASHVEPDRQGRWQADLSPVGGPLLGEFRTRSEALAAEIAWLQQHLPRISHQRGSPLN